MSEIIIRNVLPQDLDECFLVEISGFPPEEAATRETIQRRIDTFPQGFFVAVSDGRIVGMLNSASTNKEDISDEELKQLVGHDPNGKNTVVFALAVLPEFQRQGIARRLMSRCLEEAHRCQKQNVLLMCKSHLIGYYESMGFRYRRLSRSRHGGAEWHEMAMAFV